MGSVFAHQADRGCTSATLLSAAPKRGGRVRGLAERKLEIVMNRRGVGLLSHRTPNARRSFESPLAWRPGPLLAKSERTADYRRVAASARSCTTANLLL